MVPEPLGVRRVAEQLLDRGRQGLGAGGDEEPAPQQLVLFPHGGDVVGDVGRSS